MREPLTMNTCRIPDQSLAGGYGNGQAYFEGAIAVLRKAATLPIELLMCGRYVLVVKKTSSNGREKERAFLLESAGGRKTFSTNHDPDSLASLYLLLPPASRSKLSLASLASLIGLQLSSLDLLGMLCAFDGRLSRWLLSTES